MSIIMLNLFFVNLPLTIKHLPSKQEIKKLCKHKKHKKIACYKTLLSLKKLLYESIDKLYSNRMAFQFSKLNILVVEDIIPMRKLFVSVLKTLGVGRIEEAANGEEAFHKFSKNNHDIILSDWMMEPGDGLELTHKIRHSTESPNKMAPIILITGYSAWSRVESARDSGVTEFLIKPFTANDIAKRLAYVITNPRDFIETPAFFGPDRRRRTAPNFNGPYLRLDDEKSYSPTNDE